jgi:predicted site-specific integrase-resolvase
MTEPTTELPIPTPENPFRSVRYLAEALGYKEYTIREWLRDGKIKGHKDSETSEWRVLHSDFVAYCQERYGA